MIEKKHPIISENFVQFMEISLIPRITVRKKLNDNEWNE